MKNNQSFVRKIIYLVAMAVLLIPLYLLSAPSFVSASGETSAGGLLTRLRDDYDLAQSDLGEIDPASESMKLATLGMRGVAANLLWERANEYKKKEQWDNLSATLNQIAKLQPNFISVWQFQAWNLSYNVSVEFDNYEHRYHWVKKGIEFLLKGIRYNRDEPRLLWDLGWFFGHKVGRSDEYLQFRREYNNDTDFHESLDGQIDVEASKDHNNKPDNWLTAHQWFTKGQRVVDLKGVPIKGKNPLVFHSFPAKSLIRYADAIEAGGLGVEPEFGDVARIAWERADKFWTEYGQREIPTSYGYKIKLVDGETWLERIDKHQQKIDELAPPGARAQLTIQKLASLTADEKRLLGADRATLDPDEYDISVSAQQKATVTPDDIVATIEDPDKRRQAKLEVTRLDEARSYSTTVKRYRDIVNFIYWRTRCEVEQQDRAMEGRKFLWDAESKYENADLIGAVEKYDEAWKRWATIHRDHEVLAEDVTAEDLVDQLKIYRTVLTQLDRDFPPPNFPMLRLVANYADDLGFSQSEADQMLAQADRIEAQQGTDTSDGQSTEGEESSESATEPETKAATVPEPADAAEAVDSDEAAPAAGEQATDPAAVSEEAPAATESGVAEPQTSSDGDSATTTTLPKGFDLIDAADKLYRDAKLSEAKEQYEAAWKAVDPLTLDDATADRLIQHLRNYRVLLGQLDTAFPPQEFPLLDFVKSRASEFDYTEEEAGLLGN